MARKLAANARFDVRPRHRVSQRIDQGTSVEAAMLQCLEGEVGVADDCDILSSFSFGIGGATGLQRPNTQTG